jgi:hypothetical protein
MGTRLGKYVQIMLRFLDHKMDIQRHGHLITQGTHNSWSKGYVGYKVAIHHIDLHGVRASRFGFARLRTELAKVGCQYRGLDYDHEPSFPGIGRPNPVTHRLIPTEVVSSAIGQNSL